MNYSKIGSMLFACLLTLPGVSQADIPGFDKTVVMHAKGESANEFVRSLFSQIGTPVKIQGEIGGSVNGPFEGTAAEVFSEFSKTFNVHAYVNRQVVYVYRADDISERLLPMGVNKAKELVSLIETMGLTDSRNTVHLIKGAGIEVVGNTHFIQKIENLALNLKLDSKPKPTKTNNTHSSESSKTNQERAEKLIVREFRLKYASVVDKTLTVAGHEITVPGVASHLREFIDGNQLPIAVVADRKHADSEDSDIRRKPTSFGSTNSKSSGKYAHIMAYPQSNSVWIEATAERLEIYESMINTMDKEPVMVEIEATIIDINNSRQRELGINWRAIKGNTQFLLGDGSSQDLNLNLGQQITPSGEGGILSWVMGNRTQFIARMRALEKLGAAKIVSKPHVITSSNLEAILGATTEFFVRLEGHEAVSLEKKSFGTVLRVTPRVIEDAGKESIDLQISIEDGSASEGGTDNIPEIDRTVVGTQAMIGQGQSLLIGGLIRESTEDSTSQVPLLGNIPLVGNLFRSKGSRVTKMERLFLITPRIVNGDRDALNGPVLEGKIKEIVSTSDRRQIDAADEIQLKSARQEKAVEGSSLVADIGNKDTY